MTHEEMLAVDGGDQLTTGEIVVGVGSGALGGAVSGALSGSAAGPIGAVIGGFSGAVIGAGTGLASAIFWEEVGDRVDRH